MESGCLCFFVDWISVTACALAAAPWKMQKTRMMHHGAQPQHIEVTSWHSRDNKVSERLLEDRKHTLWKIYRDNCRDLVPSITQQTAYWFKLPGPGELCEYGDDTWVWLDYQI